MYFLIDHDNKYMLGWSPKCACTTIKRWFLDTKNISRIRDVHEYIGYGEESKEFSYINWENPSQYSDYKKFALVRNPYDRLVSGYLNKYIYENELPRGPWRNFEQFVFTLYRDRRFQTVDRHHFSPQFSAAFNEFWKAGFRFDLILNMEHLDRDIFKLYNAIPNLERAQLRSLNKTAIQHKNRVFRAYRMSERDVKRLNPRHRSFYSPSIRAKVLHIYAKDFFNFARYRVFYWR